VDALEPLDAGYRIVGAIVVGTEVVFVVVAPAAVVHNGRPR
jgi:hypothetical protein